MFDVITIGTATRDAFIKSKNFHVDPDHHVIGGKALVMPLGAKLEIDKMIFSTGGGATNTSVSFSRQGLKTAIISVVGNDVSGDAIIKELAGEKVFTGFIARNKILPTAYSILLHPDGGERTVLVFRGASESLSEKNIPWSRLNTKWLYVSSLAGNVGLLKKLTEFAKKKNIKIAYNSGGKELKQRNKLLPILKNIDVLTVDRQEAALITGMPFNDEKKIFQLWDKMSPGINVMTDARNGLWVSDGNNLYHAGIYKEKKVIDRTGAGDAFASGFVAGLIHRCYKYDYSSSLLVRPNFPQKNWSGSKSYNNKVKSSTSSDNKLASEDIEYAIKLGSANATAKVEGIGAKYGLLTKKQFEIQERWKYLRINKYKIY